jgi:hypothetical protein
MRRKDSEEIDPLTDAVDRWGKLEDTKKEKRLRTIYESDPNAPICLRCQNMVQEGVRFHCPLYEDPEENEKVVGQFGDVYYFRKGIKPITYPNVPMASTDCRSFERAW